MVQRSPQVRKSKMTSAEYMGKLLGDAAVLCQVPDEVVFILYSI